MNNNWKKKIKKRFLFQQWYGGEHNTGFAMKKCDENGTNQSNLLTNKLIQVNKTKRPKILPVHLPLVKGKLTM